MRRILLYMLGYLLATITLGSCTDEWEVEKYAPQRSQPSDYISFNTALQPITASAATRSNSGKLVIESEEWPLEAKTQKDADTRSTQISSFSGDAGVIGYTKTGEGSWSLLDVIDDKQFSFDGELLSASANPVPWKTVSATDQFKVYTYAPWSFVHPTSGATLTTAGTSPSMSYTVASDVANQKDLIVANTIVTKASSEYNKTLNLDFSHALTAIRFKLGEGFGDNCYVRSVAIQNVYGAGTYDFDAWTPTGERTSYTITKVGGPTKKYKEGDYITDGDSTLMMIPQTPLNDLGTPANSTKVVLNYATSSGGSDINTVTATIPSSSEWQAGKRITYIINKNATVTTVYFDLAAGPVSILYNSTLGYYEYTGFVYKNTSTTPTVQVINGQHDPDYEYYIYQSSTITDSPGYHKGWSGEIDSNGVPAAGSTLSLPEYDELKSPNYSTDGKTWSQYVTGNKDSETIIGLWESLPSHPLTLAKRTSSTNTMHFIAQSGKPLYANVTVDNVWSKYFNKSASAYTSLSGDAAFVFDGLTDGDKVEVGMNLKLKGDNFMTRVSFNTQLETDYFNITSYKGGGSTEGSLTVIPNTKLPESGATSSAYTMLASYSFNGGRDAHGFSINGGTIYVATPIGLISSAQSWTMNCLGAGTNSNVFMKIKGGAVTAVSHGEGAAIGGGAGFIYRGGDGNVEITGGKVYAYSLGAATSSTSNGAYITPTAIGGGSTFRAVANKGIVSIGGDAYVYAESIGGVAIGGGSSGGVTGGRSEVTISGNAIVYAKSVSGAIVEGNTKVSYNVNAGTSIGGGNGGNETYKYVSPEYGTPADAIATGGDAIITISGGNVYAGSIGGGKNGKDTSGDPRLKGSATVNVTGGRVQGQFIMQAPDAFTGPTFTMTGGTLQPNKADDNFEYVEPNGGAVWIGGGTFTMSGGTIKDFSVAYNTSTGVGGLGGAVYMQSYVRSSMFTMTGGSIQNCSATSTTADNGLGGAVYMSGGSFSMSGDGVIGGEGKSNTATNGGGGVYLLGGDFNMTGGTISYNRSTAGDGGGVNVLGGSFTMNSASASINNNYAYVNGGGVNVLSNSAVNVTITSGTISNNAAEHWGGGICIIPQNDVNANVTYGEGGEPDTDDPAIINNNASLAGGGLYAQGSHAIVTLHDGKISSNSVNAIVPNQDVANELGSVTLYDTDVTKVTITFDPNGGSISSGSTTQNVVKGTNSLLVAPVATRQNYDFVEWNTRADGTGTTWANGANTSSLTDDTVTLYAIWKAK